MKNKDFREHIYLAALLHDIGKFYQRADTGSVSTGRFLKDYCKEESSFCPQYEGRYSHKHVLWTAQFIDDNSTVFKTLINDGLGDLSNKDSLINLSAGHHLTKDQLSDLGKIIKEADCLSSGMDRDLEEALKDDQDEKTWESFRKKRMVSIMQTINKSEKQSEQAWSHLPTGRLSLSKNTFPQKDFSAAPDYDTLWKEFYNEFKFIQANTYRAFSETLLNLLFKYTTAIPSSTINFPDVSLYDHLKTTAAIAVCLYDYMQAKENENAPFLLIGADFSGIQSYIYQIVSQHAGKNLKGRSFYLRILSDTIVRFLLKELNLFQANVIYNSGGSFYILAPNTSATKNKLNAAIEKIEEQLFQTHGTSLFVAIDSVEVSKDALMHKNGVHLGTVWGELFSKRDRKKLSKFASQIEKGYEYFFSPSMTGAGVKRDSITGEEFMPEEKVYKEGDLLLKRETKEQVDLGKALRDSEVMVVSEGKVPYWSDKTSVEPAKLGFCYYFLNLKDLEAMKTELCASADKISVITLNGKNGNCDFMGDIPGINNIYGLEFYGGNEFNGSTFNEMCDGKGFSRMGVLRMDVDNLGSIFQSGIAPERSTLSRYAALSRCFDYFFSGYLNTIWKETAPEKSFIIYSGGDDVFIVGSWDVTISLAKRIQADFKEYACKSPAFSVSGGIAIVPAKFPIMKGADESAKEESRAKNHKCKGKEKNALSFMSMPLNWDLEFPAVEHLKNKIVELIEKGKMPKSFISKVLSHTANADIQEHKIKAIKTYWMMTYDLSRMREREKDAEVRQLIDNCKAELYGDKGRLNGEPIDTNYHNLELWAFACRWAELEYRTRKEQ